jgi:hypothetical protein
VDQLNFRPLTNDSVLRSGDHYQIRFTPEQDGYVYIFQIDSSGAIYQLFPLENPQDVLTPNRNPVRGGLTYFIPAEDEAFHLDEQVGQEQIRGLAFQKQHIELEQHYAALAEARQAQDPAHIQAAQTQLLDDLQTIQTGALPVLKFKHTARGSHDL